MWILLPLALGSRVYHDDLPLEEVQSRSPLQIEATVLSEGQPWKMQVTKVALDTRSAPGPKATAEVGDTIFVKHGLTERREAMRKMYEETGTSKNPIYRQLEGGVEVLEVGATYCLLLDGGERPKREGHNVFAQTVGDAAIEGRCPKRRKK